MFFFGKKSHSAQKSALTFQTFFSGRIFYESEGVGPFDQIKIFQSRTGPKKRRSFPQLLRKLSSVPQDQKMIKRGFPHTKVEKMC